MSREVLTDQQYQMAEDGYLVENGHWQDEIRRRAEEDALGQVGVEPTAPAAELPLIELEPPVGEVPFTPAEMEVVETPASLLEKARVEAEALARGLEEEARTKAAEKLDDARTAADGIVAKARQEAAQEIAKLREDAAALGRQDGLEKGRLEGLELGKTEGRQAYDAKIRDWDGVLLKTVTERRRALSEMESLLVELVGDALYNSLRMEVRTNKDVVAHFVQEALKRAHDRVHLKVHLNPEDMETVAAKRQELQLSVGAGNIELVADARVERGGCLLETEAGSVDGRLSTIVSQAQEALKGGG